MLEDRAYHHLHCYQMAGVKGHSRHAIFPRFHINFLNFVYKPRNATKNPKIDVIYLLINRVRIEITGGEQPVQEWCMV